MDRYIRYAALVENNNIDNFGDFVDPENVHDPFIKMKDAIFFEEFRFTKPDAAFLIRQIIPFLTDRLNRGQNLPGHIRILITLQWLGTGNYLWNLRGISNCSKSSVWRSIWEVVDILNSAQFVNSWIQWPRNESTVEHLTYFQNKYQLRNILGVVDGTHIPIQAPTNDPFENAYVNRKQYHSINTQIVCGANYQIIHIDASNVGSVHDARMWDESEVPELIRASQHSLLGDSAYPCRWYILTPYDARTRNNLNRVQQTFQRRLLAARQNVEQTLGILKQRFQVLRRPARYALQKVPSVILACCVLHNICRHFKIPVPPEPDQEQGEDFDDEDGEREQAAVGNAVRQNYIDRFIH